MSDSNHPQTSSITEDQTTHQQLQQLQRENTELKKEIDILKQHAYIDKLTGLYNRSIFEELLKEIWAQNERAKHHSDVISTFSVFYIDLDDFKKVNDTHGHLMGDDVLTRAGKILKSKLRQSDIACRTGGDEFVVVLPQTDREGALKVAEQIRTALIEPMQIDEIGSQVKIGASIGIGVCSDGDLPNDVIEKADKALYKAKAEGKNYVYAEDETK